MIFFGHVGLTAGAVKAAETLASKRGMTLPELDYRFLMAGAVLPDLLDKPVGMLLFINTFHNSRIFGHTLLFSLLLLIFGLLRTRKTGKTGLLMLGLGSFVHIVFDSMWRYPETLFWPLLNIKDAGAAASGALGILLRFPYRFESAESWLSMDINKILANPAPILYELAGGLVLLFFYIRLVRNGTLGRFFKSGQLHIKRDTHVR